MNSGVMYGRAKTTAGVRTIARTTIATRRRLLRGWRVIGAGPLLDGLRERLQVTQDDRLVERVGAGAQVDHELAPGPFRVGQPHQGVAETAVRLGDVRSELQ